MKVCLHKFKLHFSLCVVVACLFFSACSVQPAESTMAQTQPHSQPPVTVAPATIPEPTVIPEPPLIASVPTETEPTVPPHVHSYSIRIIDPTCTEAGQCIKICECGDSYIDGKIDPLGHRYTKHITAPTCMEGGFTEYICSACGDRYLDDRTAPNGHIWGEWETVIEPTFDIEGKQCRRCLNCDAMETKVLEKLLHQHHYTAVLTPPTCTEGGFTAYICSCGGTYMANETAPLGHSYIAQVTLPTCQEQGYTVYSCFCGETYKGSYTAPLGHSFTEWIVTKEPTVDAEGEKERVCRNCGISERSSVEKLPDVHVHKYSKEKIAATCTDDGYTLYTCSCGDSYREEGAAAKGHSWDHWLVTQHPTDVAPGQKERVCTVCNAIESDILDFVSGNCGFLFVDYPETVLRNSEATVRILGKPGVTYDIDVHYKSGESSAKGLEDQIADDSGYVTWTWKIGGRTAAGTYRIVVTGNGESQSVEFTVIVE